MEKNTTLSIFIPTYNRAVIIKKTLSKTLPIAKEYGLQVYISDNASTDNTEEVVSDFLNEYDNVFYSKNSTNLGLDKNHLKFIDTCKEKYVWFLGDDDYITKDGVEVVLKYTESEQYYSCIILGQKNKESRDEDIIFDSATAAFVHIWDKMPYGVLIVNRQIILERKLSFSKYIGTSHAYSSVPYEIDQTGGVKGVYVSGSHRDLFVLGKDVKTWMSMAADIYIYQIPLWFSLLPQIPTKEVAYRQYAETLSLRSLRRLSCCYNFQSVQSTKFLSPIQTIWFYLLKFKQIIRTNLYIAKNKYSI